MKKYFLLSVSFLIFGACSPSFKDLFDKSQKLYVEKNYVEAIDTLNLAIPKWKTSDGNEAQANAYIVLGKSYHEIRKFDNAIDSFKQAINLSTNSYDAAYDMGIIYQTARDNRNALNAFKEALAMKPDDPLALIGLGNAYYAMNDFSNAKQMYTRIIETAPGVQDAMSYIALCNQKLNVRTPKKKERPAAAQKSKSSPSKKSPKKKTKHR